MMRYMCVCVCVEHTNENSWFLGPGELLSPYVSLSWRLAGIQPFPQVRALGDLAEGSQLGTKRGGASCCSAQF